MFIVQRRMQQSIAPIGVWIAVTLMFSGIGAAAGQQPTVENCIMIVGDSIPHGTAVFEVPGHGFPVLQTPPFSQFVHDVLQTINVLYLGVYDLSAAATSLAGESPYAASPQYSVALTLNCRFIVIFPWLIELNALNSDTGVTYVDHLAQLVSTFQAASPQSQVVVLNFYPVATTSLGDSIYNASITQENIDHLNQILLTACAEGGTLSLAGVSCMDVSGLFVDHTHVFTDLSQEQYLAAGYAPVNVDNAAMLELYWGENPLGAVQGDGVHLNEAGKAHLAEAMVVHLYELDTAAFNLLRFE